MYVGILKQQVSHVKAISKNLLKLIHVKTLNRPRNVLKYFINDKPINDVFHISV